jgi:putative sigma-54 modulation protein
MNIIMQGTGLDLTEAMKTYIEEKISTVEKYFDNITHIAVDVGRRTEHHHKGNIFYAEVNMQIPHHDLVRVERDAGDVYSAIDMVRDQLKIELEKIKEKMRAKDKELIRETKEYLPE